jgi:GntR family transcriptional regulator
MHELPLQLELHPSSGVPLYRQLQDQLTALIASGRLAAGAMLPSVRQLAADLEVNMMTVSKVYVRLEADGLIERLRGTGMRVRERAAGLDVPERQRELRDLADQLVMRGRQLRLTQDQVVSVVREAWTDRAFEAPAPPLD